MDQLTMLFVRRYGMPPDQAADLAKYYMLRPDSDMGAKFLREAKDMKPGESTTAMGSGAPIPKPYTAYTAPPSGPPLFPAPAQQPSGFGFDMPGFPAAPKQFAQSPANSVIDPIDAYVKRGPY
jgi:hypothetical protein